jgi:hypothetical protein
MSNKETKKVNMPYFKVIVRRITEVVQEAPAEVYADSWANMQEAIDYLESDEPGWSGGLVWSTVKTEVRPVQMNWGEPVE